MILDIPFLGLESVIGTDLNFLKIPVFLNCKNKQGPKYNISHHFDCGSLAILLFCIFFKRRFHSKQNKPLSKPKEFFSVFEFR